RLLVARASGALLVAGAAQAIVLVSTGLVLVSAWGAMGIVAALVLSRSVVVVVQLRAAQSLDHHVVVSTAMEVDSAG
ncbi:MAG TPA: hypothetical protein VFC48_02765, partial [Cellulomonas sp.]|nr:hypothetical protein [Cellulomonas sp.]